MFFYSQVYYNLALAHSSSARVKHALDYAEAFWSHCDRAQYALSQAITINSNSAQSIPNIAQPLSILPYSLTDFPYHIAYLAERFDHPSNQDLEHARQTLETLRKLF